MNFQELTSLCCEVNMLRDVYSANNVEDYTPKSENLILAECLKIYAVELQYMNFQEAPAFTAKLTVMRKKGVEYSQ